MSGVRTIQATADGALPGIQVIAFHGHLHADATPGRCGPVYADVERCLLRIVEARPSRAGFDVRVETARPPLPKQGPLPGYATPIGPWQARLDDHVVVVGPAEIAQVHRLRARSVREEPPGVERFVRWLRSGQERDVDLACERIEGAAAWYCTRAESFALFERIRRVVLDDFFHAVRAGSAEAIEEHAWWLSRAAIADDDIWLAGAALRRVNSLDWEVVIREGLHPPDEQDLTRELEKAAWHLKHPPPVLAPAKAPSQPRAYTNREAVRGPFLPQAAECTCRKPCRSTSRG
jgi:hypothetical protein